VAGEVTKPRAWSLDSTLQRPVAERLGCLESLADKPGGLIGLPDVPEKIGIVELSGRPSSWPA
jgi:hypothetical protein